MINHNHDYQPCQNPSFQFGGAFDVTAGLFGLVYLSFSEPFSLSLKMTLSTPPNLPTPNLPTPNLRPRTSDPDPHASLIHTRVFHRRTRGFSLPTKPCLPKR